MEFYVCSTPYHLFISLCNIAISEKNSYIYLSTPDNKVLELFKGYEEKLKSIKYVSGIKIRKRNNIKEKFFIEHIKDIRDYKNLRKYIEKAETYIFPWNPYSLYSVSEYIFKKSNHVTLIEDGSSAYLKKAPSKMNKFIKRYIYFRNSTFYNEDKISDIRVQFPERYPEYFKNKLSKLDLKKMYDDINIDDKNKIVEVFNSNTGFNIDNDRNVIILTQPLSEDGYITEREKIRLFKDIVERYNEKYNVIIKKHPRENTCYNLENVVEIEGTFPSEIFTLLDIKFEKAIGICTSAINSISAKEAFNTDEKFFEKL